MTALRLQIQQFDRYVLTHFPTVWSTRVHFVGPAGGLLALALVCAAWIVPVTPGSVPDSELYFRTVLFLCGLVSLVWLVSQAVGYESSPVFVGFRQCQRVFLYVACLFSINVGAWIFCYSLEAKIRFVVPQSEFLAAAKAMGFRHSTWGEFEWKYDSRDGWKYNFPDEYYDKSEAARSELPAPVLTPERRSLMAGILEKYGTRPSDLTDLERGFSRIHEAHGLFLIDDPYKGWSGHRYDHTSPDIAAISACIGLALALGLSALPSLSLWPYIGLLGIYVPSALVLVMMETIRHWLWSNNLWTFEFLYWDGREAWFIGIIFVSVTLVALRGLFVRQRSFVVRTCIAAILVASPFLPLIGFIAFRGGRNIDPPDVANSLVIGFALVCLLTPAVQTLLNRVRALPQ